MNLNQCINVMTNIDLFSSFTTDELIVLFETPSYKIGHYNKGQVIHFPMTVSAKSDCLVLHLPKKLVLELCQDNMPFLTKLIGVISNKTLTLTDKINSISLKTIKDAVVDFLTFEYSLQKNTRIQLNMSKKEMAERLGVQRPSLGRELNKMRKDGLLEYDAQSITITELFIATYLD